MNRLKIALRNIVIIIVLILLFFNRSGLYLTPLSAHEHSERSIHYGPSEVAHIEDFEKGKYILCKYYDWVSCNTVDRELFFFWGFGNQVTGFENDKTKVLDFTYGTSREYCKFYGIRNDDKVNKVEITLYNGEVYNTTDFYDDLFLITWESVDDDGVYIKNIKGYDADNNIIFEEER